MSTTKGNHTVSVAVDDDDLDVVLDILWTHAPVAVSEHVTPEGSVLVAGYDSREIADRVAAALGDRMATVGRPDPTAWVATWRERLEPVDVGPFRIRLPDHPVALDRIELLIEPGVAFGYDHASTRLALALLADIDPDARTVADVGCGTGILAIAAARLGAVVDAVDNDAGAVSAAVDNAARNAAAVRVVLGSVDALPRDDYAIVMINVTRAVHRELAPEIVARTHPEGSILISGLLVDQLDEVVDQYSPWRIDRREIRGEWAAAVLVG